MQNPFSYSFGIKPSIYIGNPQYEEIINNFLYEKPNERAYMITGVRGSGKTVMLTQISDSLSEKEDWIAIDLNRERNLLQSLAANLYDFPEIKALAIKAKIDVSILGISISLKKDDRIFDLELVVEKLLELLIKSNKKLLITLDEVNKSDNMKEFCQSFQRFIRKNLPIYLVMTGLYKDIHEVKDMEGCTFLNRAPFIVIEPLDLVSISIEYKRVLNISFELSKKLALETKGYAFAFQVLGKLCFNNKEHLDLEEIIPLFASELAKYSYRILWEELSDIDRAIIKAIVRIDLIHPIKREVLIKELNFSSSMMNRYQARLKEKGVITTGSGGHGYYSLALPRFGDYIRDFFMD